MRPYITKKHSDSAQVSGGECGKSIEELNLVSATSVVGLQWGDEAKGKLVDILTLEHDIVVRYQGGNNAGHTVVFNGKTYKLSLLPTGILRSEKLSVIGPGLVVNPKALLSEMDAIRQQGIEIGENLIISDRAHVIFPHHMAEEAVLEASRKDDAIGTTMRGIGTCYRDKAGRTHAIRVGDLYHEASFRSRLESIVEQKNTIIQALAPGSETIDHAAVAEEYLEYARILKPHVTDTTARLHREIAAGKRLLFEGAQGSLLDVDHGTFPFVTSSNSSAAGIHNGSGVPQRHIKRMIGIVKAYTTRVGGGPFPTELDNEIGQLIRDTGNEYGTVTGRPRRCGWLDAVATGYSARVCGVDCIAVTLLDVLSELDEIQICEAYEINGQRTTDVPAHVEDLAAVKPIFRTLPGWKTDITGARTLEDLPANARKYLDNVAELVGVPVEFISIGPDREQTIII